MSEIRIHIDRCDQMEVAGWADRNGPLSSLDIELNGQWIGSVAPISYRRDLEQAGLGDGRRAFSYPLFSYLVPGENVIMIKFNKETLFENKIIEIPIDHPDAYQISKRRWQGDEAALGLTWGVLMTGDSLWELYQQVRPSRSTDRILEVGPGYGRLLKTALQRKIPFASYTGVELSAARVKKLTEEFGTEAIRFYQGDIETWRGGSNFNIVICSSTFEHLYPDCKKSLKNIKAHLESDGNVFIDFICADYSSALFEENGTYIRIYSYSELLNLFQSLFKDVTITTCTLGDWGRGPVERFVVVAK